MGTGCGSDGYPPEERRYYLTDANYNVMMRTDAPPDGRGVERMFYSAYGQPECFPFGDVDGDYVVDANDATALSSLIGTLVSSDVNILADLNLDGLITQADLNLLNTNNYMNHSGGSNVLSVDSEANDVGYAGYVWNDETTQWHVRNRELSPKLGRWLQRDLARYISGWNLFEYALSTPIRLTDPIGTDPPNPDGNGQLDSPFWQWPNNPIVDPLFRHCSPDSTVCHLIPGDFYSDDDPGFDLLKHTKFKPKKGKDPSDPPDSSDSPHRGADPRFAPPEMRTHDNPLFFYRWDKPGYLTPCGQFAFHGGDKSDCQNCCDYLANGGPATEPLQGPGGGGPLPDPTGPYLPPNPIQAPGDFVKNCYLACGALGKDPYLTSCGGG